MNDPICIVAAKRTPQGRFCGGLSEFSAASLAEHAAKPLLQTIAPEQIDLVILGNVLSAGQGMNIARQVTLNLSLGVQVPAYSVNMMCASGMQAVLLAAQAIRAGEAKVVLAGGTESMTNAPYLLDRARNGYRLGDGKLVDVILRDGLVDNRLNLHMAITAQKLATQYQISREAQDAFSYASQQNYARAAAAGRFAEEILPVGKVDHDEHPRPDTPLEKLATLKPTFDPQGSITAGNSSGINDGAAMLILCTRETAHKNGWQPLCEMAAWSAVGCDPMTMGLGPVHATRQLCGRTGLTLSDFDTIELNEAFAAQALACLAELGCPPASVNPDGGAIALGHPIGASGARLLVHLAHRIRRGETRRGLATLCVGGGMGIAAALARPITH